MILLLSLPVVTLGALLTASMVVPTVRRAALRVGLVDDPAAGAYKTHRQPTPYGGGIAIWLGALLPLTAGALGLLRRHPDLARPTGGWAHPFDPYLLFPLEPWSPTFLQASQAMLALGAASLLLLLGLVDDRRGLTPGLRFGLQLVPAAALTAFVPGFRLEVLGGPAWLTAAAATLWIVALTNAFNFLDNMNGLSAGLGAIALAALGALALALGHLPAAFLCLAVCGAAAGFLLHNFPGASIFMGDAGGLFLGFLGGALSLVLQHEAAGALEPAVRWLPLAVFAVPLYDLVTVVGLRLRSGRPPWLGDNRHISHRLVAAGLDRTRAVLVLYAVTAATALPCAAATGDGVAGTVLAAVSGVVVAFGLVDLAVARRRRP